MLSEQAAQINNGVEQELNRTTYPQGFPALPKLPVGRYTDAQFYQLEMKHFWSATWLFAGHVSEISEPGTYKLFQQLGQSVIISRGKDGEIRAFHNVCRHRASPLIQQPKGKAGRFTCPYHAWTYGLDGKLIGVPDQDRNFACLDRAQHGLLPVRCETMQGMIYLNLDGKAVPLSEYFASTQRELGEFPLEKMVVKGVITIDMDCNWKAAYDNFLEIYHVSTVHAKTIAPYLNSRSFLVSLFKHGHARFATRKQGASTIFGENITVPDESPDLYKDHTIGLPMFPNGFAALDPVGFGWQTWWPVSPTKTVMAVTLLGWEDQDEAFWDGMSQQVRAIAAEDALLFGDLQRSYDSGVLDSVLIAFQEQQIYWYHEEVDRTIGVDRIPDHLRVKQVLGSQIED